MSISDNPAVQPSDVDQSDLFPPLDIQSSQRLAQLARMHIRDFPMPFQARTATNGISYRFELPVENIDLSTFQSLLTDGAAYTHGLTINQDFTLDPRAGIMLMLNGPPDNGLQLQSVGEYYKNFLPGELDIYVRQAFLMHTTGYDPVPQSDVWPTPVPPISGFGSPAPVFLPEVEEYPLSLLIAYLALFDAALEAGQQYDIHTPDGVVIPRNQQFQNILSMANLLEQKYINLCSVMDCGMYRIQMSDLRRVSWTTNRLVPIYRAREYDDLNWPQRELPRRDVPTRQVTYTGAWSVATTYPKDTIADKGGQRYLSIQNVPAGKDPVVDVNPATGYGYYWAFTTLNSGWFGLW